MVTPIEASTYLLRGGPYALVRPMCGIPNKLLAVLRRGAYVEMSGQFLSFGYLASSHPSPLDLCVH